MATRALALILAAGIAFFVGIFIWMTIRTPDPRDTAAVGNGPTAEASEQISDGRINVRVFVLGDRNVRLEIRFKPDATASGTVGLRPEVKVAMVNMQMEGFDPPLELVEAGVWRADLKVPMAGRWVVIAGFGTDVAEVEFDAR